MAEARIASNSEIAPGSMKAFTVGGAVVLMANCGGALYAVSGICTHMGGHLAEGKLDGFVVRCPRHGACFDVRTGANVTPPNMDPLIVGAADLKSYSVTVEAETVSITVE